MSATSRTASLLVLLAAACGGSEAGTPADPEPAPPGAPSTPAADPAPAPSPSTEPTATPGDPGRPLPALPLRTSGRFIVDANGKRFKLASANWYGAEERDFVVAGL